MLLSSKSQRCRLKQCSARQTGQGMTNVSHHPGWRSSPIQGWVGQYQAVFSIWQGTTRQLNQKKSVPPGKSIMHFQDLRCQHDIFSCTKYDSQTRENDSPARGLPPKSGGSVARNRDQSCSLAWASLEVPRVEAGRDDVRRGWVESSELRTGRKPCAEGHVPEPPPCPFLQ